MLNEIKKNMNGQLNKYRGKTYEQNETINKKIKIMEKEPNRNYGAK